MLDDIALPAQRAAARHWFDLYAANGNRIPTLRRLDPLQFPSALSDIWIVSARDDGRFYFHLAGQNLVDWYGSSPKGKPLDDVYPPAVLPMISGLAARIIDTPAALYQKSESLTQHWSVPVPMERIGLPLADDTGQARHVFGVTTFLHRHGHGSGPQQSHVAAEHWYPLPPA